MQWGVNTSVLSCSVVDASSNILLSLPDISENLGWCVWKHDLFSISTVVTVVCTNEAADSRKRCISLGFRSETLISENLMSVFFLLLVTDPLNPVKWKVGQTLGSAVRVLAAGRTTWNLQPELENEDTQYSYRRLHLWLNVHLLAKYQDQYKFPLGTNVSFSFKGSLWIALPPLHAPFISYGNDTS